MHRIAATICACVLAFLGVVHLSTYTTADHGDGIWIDPDVLATLPTSGPAWDRLAAEALSNWGAANISDQNSGHDVATFAGALYVARTNDDGVRRKVEIAIEAAVGTEDGGRTLALGRNLTGYILAADLIGYRSDRFVSWLDDVRHETLDGRTLISTHEDRPNNWGTHAGAARIAAAVYLDDGAELARAAAVFRGFLGDRSSYAGFKYGSGDWQADPANPVGINPKGATKWGFNVDGVLPDDMRRCGCRPSDMPPNENYVWEGLQGVLAQAVLLERAGYSDVWDWSDRAILRAIEWQYDVNDFPAEGDDTFVPFLVDYGYGTSFAGSEARSGKSIGFSDWTHARTGGPTVTTSTVATTTTTTLPVTTTTTTTAPTTTTTTTAPSVELGGVRIVIHVDRDTGAVTLEQVEETP